jgi:muramoyltetrapeptide carboxypeptidase
MLGVASVHGTMAADLKAGYYRESWKSLRKALFGERLDYKIKPHVLNRKGTSEAVLVGGNISIICYVTPREL